MGSSRLVGLMGKWAVENGGIFPNVNVFSRYAMVPMLRGCLKQPLERVAVGIRCCVDPLDPGGHALPEVQVVRKDRWVVRWPDGTMSSELSFADLPALQLPGRAGKPWARPKKCSLAPPPP